MNVQKYHPGNRGMLGHYNRENYRNGAESHKSLIDHTKTDQNYNLCPHDQYTMDEIVELHKEISGRKARTDCIAYGCTLLTLPKDYHGDTREFFAASYNSLKKIYGLTDKDVVSAYVHLDETSPHMHFAFVPHGQRYDKKKGVMKDAVNWDLVMSREMYEQEHVLLQQALCDDYGIIATITDKDEERAERVDTWTKAEKQAHIAMHNAIDRAHEADMQADKASARLDYLENACATYEAYVRDMQAIVADCNRQIAELNKELDRTYRALEDKYPDAVQLLRTARDTSLDVRTRRKADMAYRQYSKDTAIDAGRDKIDQLIATQQGVRAETLDRIANLQQRMQIDTAPAEMEMDNNNDLSLD